MPQTIAVQTVRVADLNSDFQDLLLSMFEGHELVSPMPSELVTRDTVVSMFRDHVLEEMQQWDMHDWDVVCDFACALRDSPESLPPLVALHSYLTDGYHRTAALYLIGRTTFPVIHLDMYVKESK